MREKKINLRWRIHSRVKIKIGSMGEVYEYIHVTLGSMIVNITFM